MNRKSGSSSKRAADNQERQRRTQANHPRNAAAPPARRRIQESGRGRFKKKSRFKNPNNRPRNYVRSRSRANLIRLADVKRPTKSTHVEYRKFMGNGRLLEDKVETIRIKDFDGYEALEEYLYELSGGMIASLKDDATSNGGAAGLHKATVYYSTYQDYMKKPMTPMLRSSNWVFFKKSAYRMQIRWLPFHPHLGR